MSGVLVCICVALLCGLLLACWKFVEKRDEADMYRVERGKTREALDAASDSAVEDARSIARERLGRQNAERELADAYRTVARLEDQATSLLPDLRDEADLIVPTYPLGDTPIYDGLRRASVSFVVLPGSTLDEAVRGAW